MSIFNKHFWKFAGGFVGIVGLAVAVLWGFEYWQNYQEKQKMESSLKEIDQKEYDLFTKQRQKEKNLPDKPVEQGGNSQNLRP
jgi:predicted negative regulator of RcsB-dependent stress response